MAVTFALLNVRRLQILMHLQKILLRLVGAHVTVHHLTEKSCQKVRVVLAHLNHLVSWGKVRWTVEHLGLGNCKLVCEKGLLVHYWLVVVDLWL